jgi:hypothetical protein
MIASSRLMIGFQIREMFLTKRTTLKFIFNGKLAGGVGCWSISSCNDRLLI